MARKAACAHVRGHGYILEGPVRLSVPVAVGNAGKYDESFLSVPAARGNDGKSDESGCGRYCSRKYGTAIYEETSDRGFVADGQLVDVAGIYDNVTAGDTDNSRLVFVDEQTIEGFYDVNACGGLLVSGKQHIVIPLGENVQTGADTYQEFDINMVQRLIMPRHGDGSGDESQLGSLFDDGAAAGDHNSQVIPANDHHEGFGLSIDEQIRTIMDGAEELYEELKLSMVQANDRLRVLHNPGVTIPDDLFDKMEYHFQTSVVWLNEQLILEKQVHDRVKEELQEEIEQLAENNSQLLTQLGVEKAKGPGLSTAELGQLKTLGMKDVADLINNYRLLQVQLQDVRRNQALSRSTSKVSIDSTQIESKWSPLNLPQSRRLQPQGGLICKSLGVANKNANINMGSSKDNKSFKNAKIPAPQCFKGKTRIELERFFRYFEPYADSIDLDDDGRALLVGYYLPNLQTQHDSCLQRKLSYAEVKRELLNALGSDSSAATYSLRTTLDKYTKPCEKSYREVFEKLENKVAEAFGGDQKQREEELKKILLRLTQEDPNIAFSSTVIPHTSSNYYRLKELVLSTEDANQLRRQLVEKHTVVEREPKYSAFRQRRPMSPRQIERDNSWRLNRYASGNSPQKHYVPAEGSQRYSPSDKILEDEYVQRPALKCYACYKPGHTVKDCPSRGEAQMVQQDDEISKLPFTDELNQDLSVNAVSSLDAVKTNAVKVSGDKALLETRLDGVKVISMLDTGATVSVIDEKAMKAILRDKSREGNITRVRPEAYKENNLLNASGYKLKVVDCVCIPLSWDTYPSSPAIFFVVVGLKQGVLIGTNVLQENCYWIEALRHVLQAKEKPQPSKSTQYAKEKPQPSKSTQYAKEKPQPSKSTQYAKEKPQPSKSTQYAKEKPQLSTQHDKRNRVFHQNSVFIGSLEVNDCAQRVKSNKSLNKEKHSNRGCFQQNIDELNSCYKNQVWGKQNAKTTVNRNDRGPPSASSLDPRSRSSKLNHRHSNPMYSGPKSIPQFIYGSNLGLVKSQVPVKKKTIGDDS